VDIIILPVYSFNFSFFFCYFLWKLCLNVCVIAQLKVFPIGMGNILFLLNDELTKLSFNGILFYTFGDLLENLEYMIVLVGGLAKIK
jgi:hypothetical protein